MPYKDKEKQKEWMKKYRENHKEERKEYHKEYDKEYHESNKERIKARKATLYTCECGKTITVGGKSAHERSKFHINFCEEEK